MTLEELEQTVTEYMDSFTTVTLACSFDEKPWTAAVFYARQGLDLVFFSSPSSRHCSVFSKNPHAAAAIHGDYKGWREIKGLQMEGRVEKIISTKEKLIAFNTYLKRYPFVKDFFSDPLSIGLGVAKKMAKVELYMFRPESIIYLNNELGFGNRWKMEVKNGKAIGEPVLA